jgi:predicted amidohydrolase
MQHLNITLVQTDLRWEDADGNLKEQEKLLSSLSEKTDIIILPEMFSTGFSMAVDKLAEPGDGPTVKWMKKQASVHQAVITGSIIILEEARYYNRMFWITPDGTVSYYDKRHLFRMADEHLSYSPGNRCITTELGGWNIRPFICYDLRFPAWSRNLYNSFDLAIYIANWPERRSEHWRTLLRARAIENQVYVAGVNRIGRDGNGINYSGDSCVFDPLGNELFHNRNEQRLATVTLDYETLVTYRKKFPVWQDSDEFIIKNF